MRPSPRTFRLVQGQYFSLDLAGGNFFGALLSWFRVHFRLFDSILGNLCTSGAERVIVKAGPAASGELK